jgi:beta-lactamase class C
LTLLSAVGVAAIAATIPATVARAESDAEIEQLVRRHVQPMLIAAGGMAVAVHIDGRTLFYNYGMADVARKQPVTSDSLFNLASVGKVFSATLLAQAVKRGEVALDDPVAKYVTELARGGDIRKVTLGELASHTSGLHRTPQQYEPWHRGQYTLPDFIRYLDAWKADDGHQPGKQDIYSNSGFQLLPLALQRRFDTPFAKLLSERVLAPLGMSSTVLPVPRGNARGQLAPEFRRRAVQGYSAEGRAVGAPGNIQGTYNWPGTGQMFSSARDMAVFLAANLGALPDRGALQEAMAFAQQGVFTVGPRFTQALAWQRVRNGDLTIVDKNGGLNDTSTYIGMIPEKRLGIVILSNCGNEPATRIGRQIMLALARSEAAASAEGHAGN